MTSFPPPTLSVFGQVIIKMFRVIETKAKTSQSNKGTLDISFLISPHSTIVSLRYYRWQKPLPPTDNAQQQYRHVCISMPIELWEKCQHYELMIGGRWADSRGVFGRIIWATNPEKDGLSITAGVNGRRSFPKQFFYHQSLRLNTLRMLWELRTADEVIIFIWFIIPTACGFQSKWRCLASCWQLIFLPSSENAEWHKA